MKRFFSVALSLLMVQSIPNVTFGEINLIARIKVPGDQSDKSGLKDKLEDGTPLSQLGGWSAIANAGADTYWILPDRGPLDGAVSYPTRIHKVEIRITPESNPAAQIELLETILLKNRKGESLIGLASAIQTNVPEANLRFDPEGIRMLPNGEVAISDEYGPSVAFFSTATGKASKWLSTPDRFVPQRPVADPLQEGNDNPTGRQPNGGFEGLALQPDTKRLWAFTQKPLIQDSSLNKKGKRVGKYCRICEFNEEGDATQEFLYPLEDATTAVSEILALGNGQALVLERDGEPGKDAVKKQVFWIDTSMATDSSSMSSIAGDSLPNGAKPVKKQLFLDFLATKYGLAGPEFPEKPEGLALGPQLKNGDRTLLVAVDNDFVAANPSEIWVFSFSASDLPNAGPAK